MDGLERPLLKIGLKKLVNNFFSGNTGVTKIFCDILCGGHENSFTRFRGHQFFKPVLGSQNIFYPFRGSRNFLVVVRNVARPGGDKYKCPLPKSKKIPFCCVCVCLCVKFLKN